MRINRRMLAVLVVVTGSGCASARALRPHGERGAPIVPRHTASPLEPATGLVLVNPLECFALGSGGGCGGGNGYAALACAAVYVGCLGVLTAVDVVALPVQAARRHGQWRDLERIGATCTIADPAAKIAGGVAGEMIREFHFSPASPELPGATDAPAGAVVVEARTTSFTRASGIEWNGSVAFRTSEGGELWRTSCRSTAPEREVDTFEQECEAAQGEVAALADRCIGFVVSQIREAWKPEP
jgi:hypothetical protein